MDVNQRFLNADVKNNPSLNEGIGDEEDALRLDIEDTDLADIIDDRIDASHDFYEKKYNLYERRKRNETYYFGRQIAELAKEGQLKDYENKNIDNILYEIEANIKPIAMSQLPDLLVTPGNDSQDSRDSAELLTEVVNNDIKKIENRRVLGMSFKHRPVYLVGVIKCVWNPELAGGLGDYEFVVVHPDFVDFDHTVSEPNADKMHFVSQLAELTVEDVIMRFPKKEEELWEQLNKDGIAKDLKKKWKYMSTSIKIREVWFHEYKKAEDGKYTRIEGVCWKYKRVILKKIKNPTFDYTGEHQVFTYEQPNIESSKRALTIPEMQMSMITGVFPANVKMQQVYHNYFKMPRKPFYFITYDQWGRQPMDETSELEQNIGNQNTLDERLKTINEKLKTRGHHVWGKASGLKPADIEKMDHNNPDEDYLVDEEPNKVHSFIEPEMPTQQEFADKNDIRERMHQLSGDNATRGEIQPNTPATSTQIAREANYTRADDLVDETINPAATWMAQWALQMIKYRYTQEHFRWLLGQKGEWLYAKLHQNLIEEGMEVLIKASGTDKLRAENNAMNMAKMKLIDPLTFYEDMHLPQPELRAVKMMMFSANPQAYSAAFIKSSKNVTQDLINKLDMLTPPAPPPGVVQQGAPATTPQVPNPANPQPAVAPPTGPPQGAPVV